MAERISTGYRKLFEVMILHHYWLDEGNVIFDLLPQDQREKKLLRYSSEQFLSVEPDDATALAIRNLRLIFIQTHTGFLVAAPKEQDIPEMQFRFGFYINDPSFFNYTALTLLNQQNYDCYAAATDTMVRYRSNVAVFSNLTGVSRTLSGKKTLFLSKEYGSIGAGSKVEYLVKSGTKLQQLTSDQPSATTQQWSTNLGSLPVFAHQGDIPTITSAPGTLGAPQNGIDINGGLKPDVFAVTEIATVKPGDADYSCTNGGKAREVPPVFHIRFRNRNMFWRYLNKNTGALISESATPLPVTFSGNAGTLQKPSPGGIKMQTAGGVPGARIERLYNEIFI